MDLGMNYAIFSNINNTNGLRLFRQSDYWQLIEIPTIQIVDVVAIKNYLP